MSSSTQLEPFSIAADRSVSSAVPPPYLFAPLPRSTRFTGSRSSPLSGSGWSGDCSDRRVAGFPASSPVGLTDVSGEAGAASEFRVSPTEGASSGFRREPVSLFPGCAWTTGATARTAAEKRRSPKTGVRPSSFPYSSNTPSLPSQGPSDLALRGPAFALVAIVGLRDVSCGGGTLIIGSMTARLFLGFRTGFVSTPFAAFALALVWLLDWALAATLDWALSH